MRSGLLIGFGAGLVSALLFYSAARGSPLLRPILLLMTPLPSLVASLGWGWLPAALAAITGTVVIAVVGGGSVAAGYFLALGAPAALAAYLAYLSRAAADDPDGREWYPLGRLMAAMAVYAGALPVLLLPLVGGTYESMRPLMAAAMQEVFGDRLSEQALAEQTDRALFMLPAGLAVQWLFVCMLNLYVAGRIVLASGRLGRDWPDIASLTYPPGLSLLLPLALLAANAGGILGTVGTSFSGALLAAYLLAGLALTHFVARRRAPWLVTIVYAGLFLPFLWPLFVPLIALAGLIDQIFKLKQRFGQPPPTT
jgi:hypothetical protein